MTEDTWSNFGETILHIAGVARAIDLRRPLDGESLRVLRSVFTVPAWAVVTPANPEGRLLTIAENDARLDRFRAELTEAGMPFVEVAGMSPDGTHIERGMGLPLGPDDAAAIARRWEQLGIFWFDGERMWILPVLARRAPVILPALQ